MRESGYSVGSDSLSLWRDGVCSENSRDFSRLAVCTLHKGGLRRTGEWASLVSERPRRNRPYVTYVLVA